MLNKVGRDIPTNIPALEGREVYQGEFAIEPKAHRAGKTVHMSFWFDCEFTLVYFATFQCWDICWDIATYFI